MNWWFGRFGVGRASGAGGDDEMDTLGFDQVPGARTRTLVLGDSYIVGRRIGRGAMGEVYEAQHVAPARAVRGQAAAARAAGKPGRVRALLPRGGDHVAAPPSRTSSRSSTSTSRPTRAPTSSWSTCRGATWKRACAPGRCRCPPSRASSTRSRRRWRSRTRTASCTAISSRRTSSWPPSTARRTSWSRCSTSASRRCGPRPPQISQAVDLLGTPSYMAPEQARGQADAIDGRTDQFALAAIAYRMLTGQEPFQGDDTAAVLYQVVHEDPPPLSLFLPPDWDAGAAAGRARSRARQAARAALRRHDGAGARVRRRRRADDGRAGADAGGLPRRRAARGAARASTTRTSIRRRRCGRRRRWCCKPIRRSPTPTPAPLLQPPTPAARPRPATPMAPQIDWEVRNDVDSCRRRTRAAPCWRCSCSAIVALLIATGWYAKLPGVGGGRSPADSRVDAPARLAAPSGARAGRARAAPRQRRAAPAPREPLRAAPPRPAPAAPTPPRRPTAARRAGSRRARRAAATPEAPPRRAAAATREAARAPAPRRAATSRRRRPARPIAPPPSPARPGRRPSRSRHPRTRRWTGAPSRSRRRRRPSARRDLAPPERRHAADVAALTGPRRAAEVGPRNL